MAKLEVSQASVEKAIQGTKNVFNGNSVKEASTKFGEYVNDVRRVVKELEDTVTTQSAKVTELSQESQKAIQELKTAKATIDAQKAKAEADKQLIDSQEGVIKKIKVRTPKGDPVQLENGNFLHTEYKWNGTRVQVEKTPEGKKVGYNVISADEKTQRGGTFDEITQRRLSTTTKTPNGETTVTYDLNGKAENIVHEEVKLPKLVNSEVTRRGEARVLTEHFDDGTTVVTEKGKNYGTILKTDKNDNKLEYLHEYTDDYKTTTKHYKYKNNVVDTEEITETGRDTDRVIKRFKAKKAFDVDARLYNCEATIEKLSMTLKGKVSKINKFGDLEEYTYKAVMNPAENFGGRIKSVEGRCGIVKSYQGYNLPHKELKVTTDDGNKYIINFDTNGKVKNIQSLTGGSTNTLTCDIGTLLFNIHADDLIRGI